MGPFTGKKIEGRQNYFYKKTEAKHANALNIYFEVGIILYKNFNNN